MRHSRLISCSLIICLIFTQTAQAYSLAKLPYKYQHTTSRARLDGTNQSENRSSLVSRNGNINVLAINNITLTGSDISAGTNSLTDPTREQPAANDAAQPETPAPGQINLTAGNAVLVYAGQDTLEQSSSTETVTSPNAFTKIRHNVADTSFSLDAFGGTLSGTGVSISSGGTTYLEGTQITAGTSGINIDAGGDLLVYAAVDQHSSTHTETLDTVGGIVEPSIMAVVNGGVRFGHVLPAGSNLDVMHANVGAISGANFNKTAIDAVTTAAGLPSF